MQSMLRLTPRGVRASGVGWGRGVGGRGGTSAVTTRRFPSKRHNEVREQNYATNNDGVYARTHGLNQR